MRRRTPRLLAIFAVLLPVLASYALRCHALSAPLAGRQSFRQTQMAITVWCFVEEGIDPWHYQNPIFGGPWQVPFEFPLPQVTAAWLVKAGVPNIDLACRLTNVLYFTASIPLVFLLARWFIQSSVAAVCVAAAYVCGPFNIFWSQTAMIDYCSVVFALGYLYFFARFLGGRGGVGTLTAAVLFGCIGAMAKITTLPTVAVPLIWLALSKLREQARAAGSVRAAPVVRTALTCAACALIPLAVGQAWIAHTDHIKAASPATACMTSARLSEWTLGTLAERGKPMEWARIVERIEFPYLLAAGLAWATTRLRPLGRGFVWCMALSAALTVMVFLNLYTRHDYYLMACMPAVATAAGIGLFVICFRIIRRPGAQWGVLGLLLLIMAGKGYGQFVQDAKYIASDRPFDCVALGAYIRSVTAPDERLVVEGASWTPEVMYYARRKGIMWNPVPTGIWTDAERSAVAELFHQDKFTTVLAAGGAPESLRYWKHRQFLGVVEGFHFYKVSDAE
jgi:hypothetical protein